MTRSKTCTVCGRVLPLNAFYVDKRRGLPRARCKKCQNAASLQRQQQRRMEDLAYVEHRRARDKARRAIPDYRVNGGTPVSRQHSLCTVCGRILPIDSFYMDNRRGIPRARCKECHKHSAIERQQARRIVDPEYVAHRLSRDYTRRRSPEYRAAAVISIRQRIKTDPRYHLNFAMRRAVSVSLKGKKAGMPWEKCVGYTAEALRAHLEARFETGMTWENYGKWHIDHIIPKTAFWYENPDDPGFLECWALKNLQPLWARDNQSKGDRLPDGSRARHLKLNRPSPHGGDEC